MEIMYQWGKSRIHAGGHNPPRTTECGLLVPRGIESIPRAEITRIQRRPTELEVNNMCLKCFP